VSDAPRIKICGITRLEDARLAVDLGAWAVGLIFAPGSKRRATKSQAERIAGTLRRRVEVVGVFANAPLDDLVRLHERIGFTVAQLHGDEGPSYAAALHARTGIKVMKAMAIGDRGDVQALETFRDVDFHMADVAKDGRFDLVDPSLLRTRRSEVPLVLAGGLTPENVAEAAAAVRPYAVDTARGTEAEPGVKDHEKLRAFFAALESPVAAA
jgi:phosphoribosylanthranilate isomerase